MRWVESCFVLGLIRDIDRYVIKEEIAARIARQVDDPYAEVGVPEVAGAQCEPHVSDILPRVQVVSVVLKVVVDLAVVQVVPLSQENCTQIFGEPAVVSARIEAHLNPLDHSGCRDVDTVVVIVMLILAVIGTGGVGVRAASTKTPRKNWREYNVA